MRIYFDTCILQDLKNETNKESSDLILQSKGELIHCFSANDLITSVSEDETFGNIFKSMLSLFSSIPLNFRELIPKSQLPDDMPDNIKNLFNVSNMGEWMSALTNYSDTLTTEQKAFKEQLQYLHSI